MCTYCELAEDEFGPIPEEGQNINDFLAQQGSGNNLLRDLGFSLGGEYDPVDAGLAREPEPEPTDPEDTEPECGCPECYIETLEGVVDVAADTIDELNDAVFDLDDIVKYLHYGHEYISNNPEGAEYVAAFLAASIDVQR